jgi:hypothetical protein
VGCAESSSRGVKSPDDENNEEITESQGEEESNSAEAEERDTEDGDDKAPASQASKKRKPKRRRHVESTAAPQQELPPMYRKPLPPPPAEPPPQEEPAPAALSEPAETGPEALESEARRRCQWKNVAPYRPEWANSISPPLAQKKKITSKPICSYGTSPAVLKVARQIAVEQTKLKRK